MEKSVSFKETLIQLSTKTWNWDELRKIKIEECNEKLVMMSLAPDKILVSSQYYIQNIDGALSESYARETVYLKLVEAIKLLPPGYRFVVLDCWRPLKVQRSLFDKIKDKLKKIYPLISEEEITNKALIYVALPSKDVTKPSPHNTGGSVDLTIADENGLLLNMGTDFDDSTLKAKTTYFEEQLENGIKLNYKELEALKNRRLLFHIMTSVGLTNYLDEWWHYDYGNQNWSWMSGSEHAIYGKIAPAFPWNKEIE
ncbi:MAG TPA: M15 family metallopeptidase [Clostridiaceae bacterium]